MKRQKINNHARGETGEGGGAVRLRGPPVMNRWLKREFQTQTSWRRLQMEFLSSGPFDELDFSLCRVSNKSRFVWL